MKRTANGKICQIIKKISKGKVRLNKEKKNTKKANSDTRKTTTTYIVVAIASSRSFNMRVKKRF